MSRLEPWMDLPGMSTRGPDEVEAATEFCNQRGWGDGLPIVPPTVARVERMLAYNHRPLNETIGQLAPRYGALTPLRVAANAVMAGCRPEYFPLVLLALEAMAVEDFNLNGLQTTTHPGAPLAIFNGPIAREVGINGSHNAFGPGWPANATIGRAIRLALLNIGGATPITSDMATMGSPAKYGYVVAEHEEANPWEPLHVERGFARDTTTVTVVAAEGPHNVNDHYSVAGESVLTMLAGTMASTGANNLYYRGEPVVALAPEHAAAIAASGYSKLDVKRFLQQRASAVLGRFSPENIEGRFRVRRPDLYAHADLETRVPMFEFAEDLIVIVLGGAGKHSMILPSFGPTRAVTRALTRADGTPARSIAELKRV